MGQLSFIFLILFFSSAQAETRPSGPNFEALEAKGFNLSNELANGKIPGKGPTERAAAFLKRFEELDALGQRAALLNLVFTVLGEANPKDDAEYERQARDARWAIAKIQAVPKGTHAAPLEYALAQITTNAVKDLSPSRAQHAALLEFEAGDDVSGFMSKLKNSPSPAWSEGALKALEVYDMLDGKKMKDSWRSVYLSVMASPKALPDVRRRLTKELGQLDLNPAHNEKFIAAVIGGSAASPRDAIAEALKRDVPRSGKQVLEALAKAPASVLPDALSALRESRQAGALAGAKKILRDLIARADERTAGPLADLLAQTGDYLEDFPSAETKRKFLAMLFEQESNFSGRLFALKALEKRPDAELYDQVMASLHQRDLATLTGVFGSGEDTDLKALKVQIPLTLAALEKEVPGMGKRLIKEIEKGAATRGADPKNLAAIALKALAKPSDFDDVFRLFKNAPKDRLLNRNLAEALGAVVPFLREPQKTKATQALTEYLGATDPAQQIGQRMLRGRLPRALVSAIDTELDKKIETANPNLNLCDTVCGIFDKAGEWGGTENTDKPEIYYNKEQPTLFWKGATRSLKLLFLEKARPFCEKDAKPDKKLTDELAVLAAEIRKRRADETARIAADKGRKELTIEDLPTEHMTEAEKKALADFMNKSRGSGTWIPGNSVEAYGNVFSSLLARTLKEHGLNFGGKEGLTADELDRILKLPIEIGANQNSLGTTHLIASALVAATPKTPEERQKIEKILAQLEANRIKAAAAAKKDGVSDADVMHHFPYGARESDIRDEHPEGSRARAPLVRLAFYLHDRGNRNETRANLLEASDYYVQDFAKIFGPIGDEKYKGQSFHDAYDHSRAAYYATSNVLYVAAGLELARRDPLATKEQQDKADALKATLRLRLIGQMKNGLFKPQNKANFSAAATYDNPHVGLAFLSLLDEKKDKCRSGKAATPTTGIVDPTVAEKLFESAPAPKAAPKTNKNNH